LPAAALLEDAAEELGRVPMLILAGELDEDRRRERVDRVLDDLCRERVDRVLDDLCRFARVRRALAVKF
jgi:hypothetical protein